MKDKNIVLGCLGAALLGFSSTFLFLSNRHAQEENATAVQSQEKEQQTIALDWSSIKTDERKNDVSDFYMPQYKDANGVCGIAKDKYDEHVAIMSDGACPTNEALFVNYGYNYESLTDTYRPEGKGDSCGTAHLVTDGVRIGTKDMARLEAMARGDLENVGVSPKGLLCPTQAELSDDISNSVGVPVRFEYNNFDTNINKYPVFNVSTSDYQQDLAALDNADVSIANNLSGTKVMDFNGVYIPKILLTLEAKQHCEGNFGTCSFDENDMTLTNSGGKKYSVKTANEQVLPKFMMTKGAWDVCGGIFSQCEYFSDSEYPEQRGTVTNKLTHKSYTSKPLFVLVNEN